MKARAQCKAPTTRSRLPRAGAPRGWPRRGAVMFLLVLLGVLVVLSSGCRSPAGPKPGRTKLLSRLIHVPAQVVGNLMVVEVQWDRAGPWRFLIDTGSSTTLVSPEFAERYGDAEAARYLRSVRVRGADGGSRLLDPVVINRIQLVDARFERVQGLVYDLGDLSAHLGMKIDGVLGFPLFRDTILTLDYPQSRLIITTAGEPPLVPGAKIPFNAGARVPLIPVGLGGRTLLALIDSGSDGPFNLNPIGLDLEFASGPRPGSQVATLGGDRRQDIGRIEGTLQIGYYQLPRPVVDLSDELSSIGGEVLRHFTVTFDQVRGTVTFYREATTPIGSPPKRSSGISFSKSDAYWRVVGVVPESPAEAAGLHEGDLVTRINGEPVERWNLERFQRLVESAEVIAFSLLNGREERTLQVPPFVLVP